MADNDGLSAEDVEALQQGRLLLMGQAATSLLVPRGVIHALPEAQAVEGQPPITEMYVTHGVEVHEHGIRVSYPCDTWPAELARVLRRIAAQIEPHGDTTAPPSAFADILNTPPPKGRD